MNDPSRPELATLVQVYRSAQSRGMDVEPATLFHDLGRMKGRIARLQAALPKTTLHSVAIKANPVVEVLRAAVDCGAGLEAASLEEVRLALAAGCPPDHVIYDSPAKSREDLAETLRSGIRINADNLDELERIHTLFRPGETASRIGLRINPQVGAGNIAMTSVAAKGSRFGVPIEAAETVHAAFSRYPWLTGLHVHVGSQGCTLEQLVEGVRRVEAMRQQIHRSLGRAAIDTMDIGGGLPAAYRSTDRPLEIEAYAAALREAIPTLFEPKTTLITEFGRWVQASCGFAVSRVEYVKQGDEPIAVLHLGADFLLRRAYFPQEWHHDFHVLDADGAPKEGRLTPTTLGGPLCFAGDVLARGLELPAIVPGDLVLIRDTGAYTLSLWSRHCSRGIPSVLGVDGDQIRVLRERERPEDIVAFWSRDR